MHAESKGCRFPASARNADCALGWVDDLMTGSRTLQNICDSVGADVFKGELAVSQAIRRAAERAGVSTVGWSLPRG